MGKVTGFMEYGRQLPGKRPVEERLKNYREFYEMLPIEDLKNQAARCMDCGIPFCHWGCPLGNIIPEFNDMVYLENWKAAYELLSSTNNFPEFTGRLCPAPCESACVLGINRDPVTIEEIEKRIAEEAFARNLVKAQQVNFRTQKRVAVIGSGPAGLAAAAQLNKAGHWVVVFERADQLGGLLRYGIPDFKMEKHIIDRRIDVMSEEGIAFKTNANVGENVSIEFIMDDFDAVVLCAGSTIPRDLSIPGRDLKGVHFAMDFLTQQNRRVAGLPIAGKELMAAGKDVLVIGGGDTGSDCVGTSNRHKAKSITQIEILPKPPTERAIDNPWPEYASVLKNSTSHDEGCERHWNILTKAFIGDQQGHLKAVRVADVKWEAQKEGERPKMIEIAGSEREIPAQLALLAIGFVHTQHQGMVEQWGLKLDERGNIATNNYQTNVPNIFAAGDMRRGQSLIVWAISEGREAARAVDSYLMGRESYLEAKDRSAWNISGF